MSDQDTLTDEEYANVKAFNEGMAAQERGEERKDCPYAIGTAERQEWIDGYEVVILADIG
jgi:ribosome modulation factor